MIRLLCVQAQKKHKIAYARLGAPSKALTRPDLIVLDKLEDFLCERPPLTVDDTQATIKAKTGKFETHRRSIY